MSKHDSLYGGRAEVEVNLPPVLGLGSLPYWCPGRGSGLAGEPGPN